MQRFSVVFLVTIFLHAVGWDLRAQSFDYADRPNTLGASRDDEEHAYFQTEVSSYEDSVREIPPFPLEERSYAVQTLVLDGVGLLLVPFVLKEPTVGILGAGIYVLGAPLVHVAHLRPLAALASLGLRVTLPLGLALLFDGTDDDCDREAAMCLPSGEFMLGLALGVGISSTVDAVFLANEEVEVTSARRDARGLLPWVNVTREAASAGVAGRF